MESRSEALTHARPSWLGGYYSFAAWMILKDPTSLSSAEITQLTLLHFTLLYSISINPPLPFSYPTLLYASALSLIVLFSPLSPPPLFPSLRHQRESKRHMSMSHEIETGRWEFPSSAGKTKNGIEMKAEERR